MNKSWLQHRPGFFMGVGAAIVSLALTAFFVNAFVRVFELDWYKDESGLITGFTIWFFVVMAAAHVFLVKFANAQDGFGFLQYLRKGFAFYVFLFLVAYILIVAVAALLTNGDIILFEFKNLRDVLVGPAVLLAAVFTYNLVPFFVFVLFNFCLIKLHLKERAKNA